MPQRVLIIDDHGPFRAAARQLLERAGFIVVAEAAAGLSGIERAQIHHPDIAIVDVQLPDCDGFEVAARLPAAVHVILISSLDSADFGALVASSPALGFIPKADLSAAAIEALIASAQ